MKKIFDISIAKEENGSTEASSNEDAFDYDFEKQVFALSDGASESYNSKKWAKILVNEFVDSLDVSQDWLLGCIKKYVKSLDLTNLTESQFIAFNKGSFATLIGVRRNKNKLNILNVGDSHIFIVVNNKNTINSNGGKNLEVIPLFDKPDFDDNPTLVSSKLTNNSFIDFDNIEDSQYFKVLDLDKLIYCYREFHKTSTIHVGIDNEFYKLYLNREIDVYLFCATDAVAEWIFKNIEANDTFMIFNFLLSLKEDENKGKFEEKVIYCREEKAMKIDDSTLVILKCDCEYGLS